MVSGSLGVCVVSHCRTDETLCCLQGDLRHSHTRAHTRSWENAMSQHPSHIILSLIDNSEYTCVSGKQAGRDSIGHRNMCVHTFVCARYHPRVSGKYKHAVLLSWAERYRNCMNFILLKKIYQGGWGGKRLPSRVCTRAHTQSPFYLFNWWGLVHLEMP